MLKGLWDSSIFTFCCLVLLPVSLSSQTEIPDDVLDIFDERCISCHAGTSAPRGLDLTEDFAFSGLVNKPSADHGKSYLRVKPQDPARSYLIMKLKGVGIKGDRMPKGDGALSATEISAIEVWINSLPANASAKEPEREFVEAFPGLSLATLPTTQTLEKGGFSYRIAHRWRGRIEDGFDQFFGLDGGAVMYTQLDFPLSNDLQVSLGRSGARATYQLAGKWRFLRQKSDGSMPVSAAFTFGLDWSSRKSLSAGGAQLDRTDGERFHFFGQLPLSTRFQNLSLLLVPGVLLNGNTQIDDEDALITIGFAGKFEIMRDFSVFVEGVPIVAGDSSAEVLGVLRREGNQIVFNDAFTLGLEKRVGGHVFHVYVTNSLGLTTNHYMSGSDLDFTKDMRLGFNIYRKLGL